MCQAASDVEIRRIGIAADDAAFELKQTLVEHLEAEGYEVQNHGPSSEEEAQRLGSDYPNVAVEVSEAVAGASTCAPPSATTRSRPSVLASRTTPRSSPWASG